MNINLGNQGQNWGFTPMMIGQATPYLSPLCGSLSAIDQESPDQLLEFRLQQQSAEIFGNEPEPQAPQPSFEIYFVDKESSIHEKILVDESQQEKTEIQTPFSSKPPHSKVYSMIQFLVINDKMPENLLFSSGRHFFEGSKNLQFVFKTLLTKFKKLKKTKEQMVKYCMRKAFKFVSDLKKTHKTNKNRKQKNENSANIDKELNFQMPFRKNSSQKTMNAQFLKHMFSSKEFANGYGQFLGSISQIIEDDNISKIAYLAESIQKILCNNQIKEIEAIKRLPWTKTILVKTQELAHSLIQFAALQQGSIKL